MHLHEITRPDVPGMVLQERGPRLLTCRGFSDLVQIFLDRSFADPNPQFQELAPNALCTPQPVVLRHLLDELDGLLRDPRFAALFL